MSSYQEEYRKGYRDGYKSVQGNVVVPVCPVAPITPAGSKPYDEGYKAGVKDAGGG